MRFESIEIANWGPFRGSHEVETRTEPKAPLILIFGENGKGKTSLANAVQWCLFGDQSGIDPLAYANKGACRDEDEFDVIVRLHYSVDSWVVERSGESQSPMVTLYELERRFTVRHDERFRLGVRADDMVVSLLENGSPVGARTRDEIIAQSIPHDMSRFFLFDGEELNSIRRDLERGEGQSIRDAIVSVLGLPALEDLESLLHEEERKIQKAMSLSDQLKREREAIESLDFEVDRAKRERQDLAGAIQTSELAVKRYQDLVKQTESVRGKFEKLEECRIKIDDETADLVLRREDVKVFMKDAWWLPLAERIKKSQTAEVERRARSDERERLKSKIEALEASLRDHVCVTCHQELGNSADLKIQIGELQNRIGELKAEGSQTPIGFNERFPDPGARIQLASSLFQDERRSMAELSVLKREERTLTSQVENLGDAAGAVDALTDLMNEKEHLGKLRVQFERAKREYEELNLELQKKSRSLQDRADLPKGVREKQAVIRQLRDVLEHVRGEFLERVRVAVEQVASQHFVAMMNNPDLVGIAIGEDFTVRINHRLYDEKDLPSAGQSLIAVYAFVGALIDISEHGGAWMIDTVGSRLDSTNMRSVWQWLAGRERQVIALPHSNELRKSEVRDLVGSRLSAAYEIVDARLADADSEFVQLSL